MIRIGLDGVQVEPVADATKIAIAFFTTIGAMLMMLGRMRSAARLEVHRRSEPKRSRGNGR